jgi:DNA repair protein RadC
MGGAETLLYPSSTVQGWELLTMGYTQETTLQMTLLAKEKITKPKSASVPVYKVTLVREGRVSCYQQQIRSSADASTLLHTYLADVDREHFAIILLNQKNRVVGVNTVSIGSLTASVVHPREVFKPAILSNAAAIILAHNHPSGQPQPSQEDRVLTVRLVAAGKLLGISVLDHVIIGDGTSAYFSFADEGLLQ